MYSKEKSEQIKNVVASSQKRSNLLNLREVFNDVAVDGYVAMYIKRNQEKSVYENCQILGDMGWADCKCSDLYRDKTCLATKLGTLFIPLACEQCEKAKEKQKSF